MHDARHHGLAGKARRARNVGRANRFYLQQLLDEYYEDRSPIEAERFIPVRNHYEFLPSVGPEAAELPPMNEAQSELTFLPPLDERFEAAPVQPSTGEPVAESPPAAKPRPVPVLRPRVTLTPSDHCHRRAQKLTPSGFLVGAAAGSAAAAVLLLILQLAVG